jgi:hypothetical protein
VIDPVQAFNTLFRGYVPTSDPTAAMAAMRARAKGRSVIDFVVKDVNRMNTRLAAVEQQKLQQHLDSIRDLEKQFRSRRRAARAARPAPSRATPNKSHVPFAEALQRRRAVLRRDHGLVHRPAHAGLRLRHHALSRRSSWRTCRTRATRWG